MKPSYLGYEAESDRVAVGKSEKKIFQAEPKKPNVFSMCDIICAKNFVTVVVVLCVVFCKINGDSEQKVRVLARSCFLVDYVLRKRNFYSNLKFSSK